MTPTSSSNGNVKILMSILATLFTAMILRGYASLASDVSEATRLTTKHEADIGYIRENLTSINNKLDILVNQKLSKQ